MRDDGKPTQVGNDVNRPLATFALIAYNQERFIREAVEGALSQTYRPLEIILSDDCSTDRTFDVMRELVASYDGPHAIRLNRTAFNLGLVAHVNEVVRMAAGEILVLAAGDDLSLPNRVQDSVDALRQHPKATMVSFMDEIIDEAGVMVRDPGANDQLTEFDLDSFIELGPLAQRRLQVSGASRAIRKSVFEAFGDMRADCPAEDTPLILRALYLGTGLVCHWPGIRYRQHRNQVSEEGSIARMDLLQVKKQYLNDLNSGLSKGVISTHAAARTRRWIRESDLLMLLRQCDFLGAPLSLGVLLNSARSAHMTWREKLGVAKRYLVRSRVGRLVKQLLAHLCDLITSPAEYVQLVVRRPGATDRARWSQSDSYASSWDCRTLLLARQIRCGERIVEFGAGKQALREMLPWQCTYIPFDLVKRTPDTIVSDLNEELPDLRAQGDVAVLGGVVEYLNDPRQVFRWLHMNFSRVVFSYAITDRLSSPLQRRRHGWVNHLARSEIISLVSAQGYSCRVVDAWRNHLIFVASRP